MMSPPVAWTRERERELLRLVGQGKTSAHVSKIMGLSERAVKARLAWVQDFGEMAEGVAPVERPCMSCQRPIASRGPGHRMCADCRRGERDYTEKDRSYNKDRWGPSVAERDAICRQVIGMAPRRAGEAA